MVVSFTAFISTGLLSRTASPSAASFETVAPVALTAEYWLQTGSANSKAEITAQDARYADFRPYKTGRLYNNRRTNRTDVTYATGGVAYIYFCYGIHHMLIVVTNEKDIPNVVLIRALEPLAGMDTMLLRSKKTVHGNDLTRGPGNVGKSMGIHTRQSGISLQSNELFIADDGVVYNDDDIMITPRIGVDYAAEDALLPYRFLVKGNSYVSGKKRFQ